MQQPKVLLLDIETSPLVAYVWGRKDVNIGLNQIKDEWYVLSFAAKWLGEKKIYYVDHKADYKDDKRVLACVWSLLDEADIVITQNGKNFDAKKLNARFIMYGMMPPSPYRHLDTYQIVRRVAAFTSNKLEYLTEKLCTKYKKLKHNKFPGMSLWVECMAGNPKAWAEMKRYNIHDVLSLEEFYGKIKAWAPDSAPKPYRVSINWSECAMCDKGPIQSRGTSISSKGVFARYQCQNCGHWSQGKKELS